MKRKARIVPVVFYVLTGLTALAGSMILYVWYRELVDVFGNHAVSTSTILVSLLLCMAIGSRFAGGYADSTEHRLERYVFIALGAGSFALCHPLLIKLLDLLTSSVITMLHPGPFGFALLRLLFSLFYLLIPAASITGIFLLVVRQFIRHPARSGDFMSSVIMAGATGSIAGLLLLFLLIPRLGMQHTLFAAAASFIIPAVITYFLRARTSGKHLAGQVIPAEESKVKSAILFRKKRAVLEAGIKLKRATVRVFALQGFTAAAFLGIACRILGYYNELKPVYFYTLITLVVLIGMALGSILYRRTAGKHANSFLTLATYQILTGLALILAYVALYLVHRFLKQAIDASVTFSGVLFHHVLLFATLTLIPAIFLGISLPLTGKLYADRIQNLGSSFGRLGFIWPLAMLSGMIVTRFILIPSAGLYYSYFIVVFLTILSGAYLILRDSRLIRGFRLGYALVSMVVYFLIIVAFKSISFNFPEPGMPENTAPLARIEGSTTSLTSYKKSDNTQVVLLNNAYCFSSDPEALLEQQFPAYLALWLNDSIQTAVVVGFGTGITAHMLENNKIRSIHIAETYPEIIRYSSDLLADVNDDILTSSRVTVTIEDGRSYLTRTPFRTDLITAGCAQPLNQTQYCTLEFYRLCHDRLTNNGMLCQVIPVDRLQKNEFMRLVQSCARIFPDISLWYLSPGHLLLAASKSALQLSLCRLYMNFSRLNRNDGLAAMNIPDAAYLMGRLMAENKGLRNLIRHEQPFTDDRPGMRYGHLVRNKESEAWQEIQQLLSADYSEFLGESDTCSQDLSRVLKRTRQINASLRKQQVPAPGLP
jgi:spermidine synthase